MPERQGTRHTLAQGSRTTTANWSDAALVHGLRATVHVDRLCRFARVQVYAVTGTRPTDICLLARRYAHNKSTFLHGLHATAGTFKSMHRLQIYTFTSTVGTADTPAPVKHIMYYLPQCCTCGFVTTIQRSTEQKTGTRTSATFKIIHTYILLVTRTKPHSPC